MASHRNDNLRLTWRSKLIWIHTSKRTLACLPCKSIRNKWEKEREREQERPRQKEFSTSTWREDSHENGKGGRWRLHTHTHTKERSALWLANEVACACICAFCYRHHSLLSYSWGRIGLFSTCATVKKVGGATRLKSPWVIVAWNHHLCPFQMVSQ